MDDTQRHDTSGRLLVSSYQIKKVMPYTSEKTIQGLISLPKRPESNIIDISTLDNGIYILTVYDIKGGCHTFEIYKKQHQILIMKMMNSCNVSVKKIAGAYFTF